MSRFNKSNTTITKTDNFAGGEAFIQNPKLEFVSILLTSFVKDQFYRSADDTVSKVNELIHLIPDKKFMAKAAIYARTKYGMRSISHVVAGEVAKSVKGETWTKNFFDKVIFRPDDMTEILAYYYALGEKNEPNALKKGFASAFSRFDEYQLAKYRKEGAAVSLIDVVNLVHPPHSEAISKLINGTLPTPKTWEAKLSAAGQEAETEEQKEELKKDVWIDLIKTRKIGYFALLRNLRNILEQAPEIVEQACELLEDEKLISKSLVLPFRYSTAMDEMTKVSGVDTMKVRAVMISLAMAMDKALSNVPRFEGTTLVVLDESSSMGNTLTEPHGIGSLFAAVLVKSNNADFMAFSDDARYQNLNPMDTTLTIASEVGKYRNSSGTNFHSIFQMANKAYDRIIILSDMQGWIGYDTPGADFAEYKKRTGANPKIYSFDLQGYGTMQFPENNVYALTGFSEKVFDVIKMLETDRNALISEIEKIQL